MRNLLIIIIGLLSSFLAKAQVVFFDEGTTSSYYDQGIVDINNLGNSQFEHTYPPGNPQWNDKIPCVTSSYKGSTALKFNYTSSSDGNWKVTVYKKSWSTADITSSDSLSFYLYCEEDFPAEALPKIAIKANLKSGSGDQTTALYTLSDYNESALAGQWIQIRFPLGNILNDSQNSDLDFTQSKGIIFNQSESDNSSRLIYIDEITTYEYMEFVPEVTDFKTTGYDSHVELEWETPQEDLNYRIEASFDGGNNYELRAETADNYLLDFIPQKARNTSIQYRIYTIAGGNKSAAVTNQASVRDYSDDELMNMVQEYTFRYFWEGADPNSGMTKERTSGTAVASGASGMGLMAMIVAYERSYRPQSEVKDRILQMLNFLKTCDRHHGAWSHWYHGNSGVTKPFSTKDDGGDMVETSFVASALIALKNYFISNDNQSIQIREMADELWREIEWDWYQNNGEDQLYWHWSPNYDFEMNMRIRGWNESLITYIMAASSPTYGISKEVYDNGWANNGGMVNSRSFYGYDISLAPDYGGPLFWIHYTHLGIDPHNLYDAYADYWEEHVNTVKIHYTYAVNNPKGHKNYSDKCWGLTSSDDPDKGYSSHKPLYEDNGTIAPTAALASMPYAPEESMKAIKYFYRERGSDLFGRYGFYDAFNDNQNWVKQDYLGIDQGPILIMLENYRTGLLWESVMNDSDVQEGLSTLGFNQITSVPDWETKSELIIYPNPSEGQFKLSFPEIASKDISIRIYNLQGQQVYFEETYSLSSELEVNASNLSTGCYVFVLQVNDQSFTTKLIIK